MMATDASAPELVCYHCNVAIQGEPIQRKNRNSGEVVMFHVSCWERIEEWRAQRIRRMSRAREGVPGVPWTSYGDPEFLRRVSLKLANFAKKYDPEKHGSALLLGPSGSGKTLAAAAMYHRLARGALTSEGELEYFVRCKWVTGHALARARKEHSLGAGEAPAVQFALDATLLVIDELGFEPVNDVLFEVVDQRYSRRWPTVVTSGLTLGGFSQRYGDAFTRRLTGEGSGRLVDVHPETQGDAR